MIDALREYITQKGFQVEVYPEMLVITKKTPEGGEVYLTWRIAQLDIKYLRTPKKVLFVQIDEYMRELDAAIEIATR